MTIGGNNRNPISEIIVYIGFVFICIICFLSIAFLNSCCSPESIEKVETKIEYRDRIVKDTVELEIPVEIIHNVTTDTLSIVETSLAKSDAKVVNGFLFHSIENKPQKIQKPVEIHVTDTVYISNSETIEKPKPEIVKVEKELSWWQRVRLDTYYILLGLIAVYCIIKYRKWLWSIIKSIL